MDRSLWLSVFLVCVYAARVDTVECVKKYDDETVKVINCSECCGGVYTRYCCQPPVQEEEPESEFSASIIAAIVISVIILVALIIAIAVCAAWYFCDCFGIKSPLAPYKSHPPPIVIHKVENKNLGYNTEEFDGLSATSDNWE